MFFCKEVHIRVAHNSFKASTAFHFSCPIFDTFIFHVSSLFSLKACLLTPPLLLDFCFDNQEKSPGFPTFPLFSTRVARYSYHLKRVCFIDKMLQPVLNLLTSSLQTFTLLTMKMRDLILFLF